jgi:hypothetical protein
MVLWCLVVTRRVTVNYHDFEQAEYQDGLDKVKLAGGVVNFRGCCEFASDYISLIKSNRFSEITEVRRFPPFIHVLINLLYNS